MKKAEDGGALVLRFCNTSANKAAVSVIFNTDLTGGIKKAVETDILERPLEKSGIKFSGGSAEFAMPGKAITTIAVHFL